MGIGKRIKEARINKGMKQDELAKLIGVTPSAIGNYENEISHPKENILYKLFNALDCDANYLFQDEMKTVDTLNVISPQDKTILAKYNKLDAHGKKTVDLVLNEELERINTIKYSNPKPLHIYTAPKYAATVSAGTGNYIMSDFADNIELTSPPPKGTNYIVTVSGDSMEPTYSDGDMLYIKSCPDIETGQIGIYVIDGSSYVKEKGTDRLISHNKNYGDIQSGSSAQCLGLVLGKVDENDIYKAGGI